jgi:hypothetical protein
MRLRLPWGLHDGLVLHLLLLLGVYERVRRRLCQDEGRQTRTAKTEETPARRH